MKFFVLIVMFFGLTSCGEGDELLLCSEACARAKECGMAAEGAIGIDSPFLCGCQEHGNYYWSAWETHGTCYNACAGEADCTDLKTVARQAPGYAETAYYKCLLYCDQH